MTEQNTVEFGATKFHIAFHDEDGFGSYIHIPGLVNISLTAEDDTQDFAADNNSKYYTTVENKGYTGTIEVATFPDEVIAKMTGSYIDEDGGLVEDANGTPCPFACAFEGDGDKAPRRTVWYKVTATRPGTNASTGKNVQTKTLNISVAPMYFEDIDKNIVKKTIQQGESAYDSFFTKVVEPKGEKAAEAEPAFLLED